MILKMLIISILLLNCSKDPIQPDNILVDVDGNSYLIETFGTQTWMLDDLKTTRYYDSTPIPDRDGNKYTFYIVADRNICPINWHVPKDWEWYVLVDYFDKHNLPHNLGNLGYWWSASTIVDGYEIVQSWAWAKNQANSRLFKFPLEKEQYLSVRCVKD